MDLLSEDTSYKKVLPASGNKNALSCFSSLRERERERERGRGREGEGERKTGEESGQQYHCVCSYKN